jgi:TRAP transporter TAXI family solute receptor
MNRLSALVLAVLAFVGAGVAPHAAAQMRQGVLIGTATPGGVYYPLGGSICRLFNFTSERHGLRCAATLSEGSIDNIAALRVGEIDVAIVQSDVLADAVAGTGAFQKDGAWPALRVLFVAHDEPFTIVARRDSGIANSTDLIGKRINVGPPGSGYRLNMERLAAASNLTRDSFSETLELSAMDQAGALCAGRIDAFVYSVGHPNGLVQDAINRCQAKIVPVHSERIDAMLQRHREYRRMNVPGGLYAGHPDPVPTFGVNAAVITTDKLPAIEAYELVRSVFEDFDEFTRLHPALALLNMQSATQALPYAAFHDAAAKYFRERGLTP